MRICIDPGHTFGSNPSPADPTYSEGTRMFALARFLRRALERYGAEVVCTRGSFAARILPRIHSGTRFILKEPLKKSAAALSGSFAPTDRFENLEIRKGFLQFPNLNLEQNPSLTALAI